MSRAFLPVLSLALTLPIAAFAGTPAAKPAAPARAAAPAATAAPSEPMAVVLETARGRIVIQLADKDAPKTAANFVKLVKRGFYDGTTFHRVIPGFMIQGGDPNSKDSNIFNDGQGGPGYTVPAEIKLPHLRGAIAMARMPDAVNPKRESSGSQFFICVADRKDLDRGGYTVFGKVVQGMDVVDAIVALADRKDIGRTAMGANPGTLALIRKATLEPLSKYAGAPAQAAPAQPVAPRATPAAADSSR
ncbi:MAG: peptidylprolyl isomerase [Candidatus Eisenbacteria bacterium]|uniref:Peptidyl-prolyl cis-trans isomerase n=1 Tax=Eiseniibacteriota bacterium TaxID=2212470 RepID=A0A933SB70_UNCEI|nr:peptidylprolyl isomerase [Candidatus Eisenbacteria bacterium]